MGWLLDTLKEIPLSAVLKEKIAAIEDKYAAAETQTKILEGDLRKANAHIAGLTQENQRLNKQIEELSHSDDLDDVEIGILKDMADIGSEHFTAENMAIRYPMTPAKFRYHLQRLDDADLAKAPVGDDAGWHWSRHKKG
jgi:chromosome segregation ATPase